jgi:uncharacterized cupin superfamily protein
LTSTSDAELSHETAFDRDTGLSLWGIPPGEAAYPYHFRLAEEELLIVLPGRPSLRTSGGWRTLDRGEVVSFPVGLFGLIQTGRYASINGRGVPGLS